jgi:DNA-binding CsgD family transcriptional regulator
MGHRTLPTTAETVRVMRHLADVTSLKGDPPAQRTLLVDGLSRLFGTTFGWCFVFDDCRPGRVLRPVVGQLVTDPDPTWLRYMDDFLVHVPPSGDPFADHAIRSDDAVQQWTLDAVLPDLAAHRRYPAAVDLTTTTRVRDSAVCAFRTGPAGDRLAGFSLHRADHDPRMRPRDYALHRFALGEIRRLHDRGHLPSLAPPPARPPDLLPMRQRQILDRLLLGRAPKKIATDLGLSVWTVRDHVKRIYARYGAHGRDELMARFVDRPGGSDGDG